MSEVSALSELSVPHETLESKHNQFPTVKSAFFLSYRQSSFYRIVSIFYRWSDPLPYPILLFQFVRWSLQKKFHLDCFLLPPAVWDSSWRHFRFLSTCHSYGSLQTDWRAIFITLANLIFTNNTKQYWSIKLTREGFAGLREFCITAMACPWLFLLALCIVSHFAVVFSFNVDVREPFIYSGTSGDNFGYSVTLHQQFSGKKWWVYYSWITVSLGVALTHLPRNQSREIKFEKQFWT